MQEYFIHFCKKQTNPFLNFYILESHLKFQKIARDANIAHNK